MANPRRVAQNIIQEHGHDAFKKLIEMFNAGESGSKIGVIFNVTRQRVSQWKKILGTEKVEFIPADEIKDLC